MTAERGGPLLIEDCTRISIAGVSALVRAGVGTVGYDGNGCSFKAQEVDRDHARVHVAYAVPSVEWGELHRDVVLDLEAVPSVVGGRRWRFACPRCGASAVELAVPPGEVQLGCRGCLRWTYRCRRSRRVDLGDLLRREEETWERLRRARSPKRIERLRRRAVRLARKRCEAMARPTLALLGVLESTVGRSGGRA